MRVVGWNGGLQHSRQMIWALLDVGVGRGYFFKIACQYQAEPSAFKSWFNLRVVVVSEIPAQVVALVAVHQ